VTPSEQEPSATGVAALHRLVDDPEWVIARSARLALGLLPLTPNGDMIADDASDRGVAVVPRAAFWSPTRQ
jgi:hypothetical protein